MLLVAGSHRPGRRNRGQAKLFDIRPPNRPSHRTSSFVTRGGDWDRVIFREKCCLNSDFARFAWFVKWTQCLEARCWEVEFRRAESRPLPFPRPTRLLRRFRRRASGTACPRDWTPGARADDGGWSCPGAALVPLLPRATLCRPFRADNRVPRSNTTGKRIYFPMRAAGSLIPLPL